MEQQDKVVLLEKVVQAQREIIQGYYIRLASHPEPTVKCEDILAWLENDMQTIRMENLGLEALQILSQKPERISLSEMTDEDNTEVAKILKPNDEHTHNSDYGRIYVKQLFDGVMYSVDKIFKLYQFLQSRNYELPDYLNK